MKSDDSKLYDVEKLIQHEDFSIKNYNNDVAILKVMEEILVGGIMIVFSCS